MVRTMAVGQGALAITTVLLAAACAGSTSDVVVRADSAGVAIVNNAGGDRLLNWTFERVLDLGGDTEGPTAFHRVHATSVGTDGAGRLYALDAGNYVVTVFDSTGTVLRTLGRQGSGPGELRFPSDLAVGDDGTVVIWDFDAGGFIRFAPDGEVLPTVTVAGALQRKLAVSGSRLLGSFQLYDSESSDSSEFQLLAVRTSETGEPLEITRARSPRPVMAQFSCMAVDFPPFLSPGIVWDASNGRTIARTTAEYVLDVYDANAVRSGSWRRDLPLIPATIALAAAEFGGDSLRLMSSAGRCAVSADVAAERIGFNASAPHIAGIAIARDGHVWVKRRTPQAGEFLIDVLSVDGAYLGTLPAGSPFPAAFRGNKEIVTVEQDDLDLPHIIVYRIVRQDR